MSTTRFCPTCSTDVEDAGGFCLLGHSLRLAPVIQTAVELRGEVHRTFEDARSEVAAAMALIEIVGEEHSPHMADAPPPALHSSDEEPAAALSNGMASLFSPRCNRRERTSFDSVWEALEENEQTATTDPIEAFAPPARMDWGPERPSFFEKKRFGARRPRLQEAASR